MREKYGVSWITMTLLTMVIAYTLLVEDSIAGYVYNAAFFISLRLDQMENKKNLK